MKKTAIILLAALCLPLAFCKKDKSLSSKAEYYFIGKLDGTDTKLEVTANNDIYLTNSNGGSIGTPDCVLDYGCAVGTFEPADPYFSVDFPALFAADCSTEAAVFPTLFHTGSWSYGDTGGKVQVSYFDGTEIWSTSAGAQTGSTFEVTRSEDFTTIFGVSQNVDGKLSCTLFSASGASKKLEGASFKFNFTPNF